MFNPIEVRNGSPKTTNIVNGISAMICDPKNFEIWGEMETFLIPPGKCGSKAFDQANAVSKFRKMDVDNMFKNHSDRALWDYLQKSLRKIGFRIMNGCVVGLLEYKVVVTDNDNVVSETLEEGQPDVE